MYVYVGVAVYLHDYVVAVVYVAVDAAIGLALEGESAGGGDRDGDDVAWRCCWMRMMMVQLVKKT